MLATKWAKSRQKQISRITNRSRRLCNNLQIPIIIQNRRRNRRTDNVRDSEHRSRNQRLNRANRVTRDRQRRAARFLKLIISRLADRSVGGGCFQRRRQNKRNRIESYTYRLRITRVSIAVTRDFDARALATIDEIVL